MTSKKDERTLEGDGNTVHLYNGGSYMAIYVCQRQNCILKWVNLKKSSPKWLLLQYTLPQELVPPSSQVPKPNTCVIIYFSLPAHQSKQSQSQTN